MYKLKRVYICDACDAAALPRIRIFPCGGTYRALPEGWEKVGGMHFCPVCYEAWRNTDIKDKNTSSKDETSENIRL